jgi:peptide deformylase
MILPVVAFGTPVLRETGMDIDPGYPNLDRLIADMWETMYHTNGVGLAAPQVNRNIRLFVIDSEQVFRNQDADEKALYPDEPGFKQVFINARVTGLNDEEWVYNEGCLSIPKIREDITRPVSVTIRYQDEQFNTHEQTFNGVTGRIILHEYDHIEGKLFIDYLSALKRRLIKGKLDDISKGRVKVDYRMSFPK